MPRTKQLLPKVNKKIKHSKSKHLSKLPFNIFIIQIIRHTFYRFLQRLK
ncbi:hypothetical Protein psc1_03900 [Candidatus Phytoplasma solani]